MSVNVIETREGLLVKNSDQIRFSGRLIMTTGGWSKRSSANSSVFSSETTFFSETWLYNSRWRRGGLMKWLNGVWLLFYWRHLYWRLLTNQIWFLTIFYFWKFFVCSQSSFSFNPYFVMARKNTKSKLDATSIGR